MIDFKEVTMKIITVLFTAILVFSTGFPGACAEEAGKEKEIVKAPKGKGNVEDFLASFWSKVVKIGKKEQSTVPTSVAGLRGVEQEKGKELRPYWKGKEKSKDGAAMAKVESLINKKDFAAAIEELKSFGQTYPHSPLKPIALLSLAYCYIQIEKSNDARQIFEAFIKDYPDHELTADARAGIELLKDANR